MNKLKLLQINISANRGSHGRIAEEIGRLVISQGGESLIAYGRWANPSESQLFRIGSDFDEKIHAFNTRLFDTHGLCSKYATKRLIKKIEEYGPDIIHLHNIHGYYLNYPLLFEYMSHLNIPVVWTLHDCWSFTGHCAHFTYYQCNKWKSGCKGCQYKQTYPKSIWLSNSSNNFLLKQNHFNSLNNLTLVPVSNWLNQLIDDSLLKKVPRKLINNGIDLQRFIPVNEIPSFLASNKKVILGVSFDWDETKGLRDFVGMRSLLDDNYLIVLVGLNKKQIKGLPEGIIGIERTQSIKELVQYYSRANVFVNPTYEDTFPTTNLEALACGTPVVTYKTGGSPEAIDSETGCVVACGDIVALSESARNLADKKEDIRMNCRHRAEIMYNKDDRYMDYYQLYQLLLQQ